MLLRLVQKSAFALAAVLALAPSPAQGGLGLVINEVDADTPGTDEAEFLEIYDGGIGNVFLTSYVLVFYDGSNDLSYYAFDLDGFKTSPTGYFVLCATSQNTPNCTADTFPNIDLIHNGPGAVVLYSGDAISFPTNTPVTMLGLADALVYDTSDADDPGLLVLLNPGQPQVDENAGGTSATVSNQRCGNGDGGTLNTSTYLQAAISPGATNTCPPPPVAVKIHDVQGNGAVSPLDGVDVEIEAIVTGVRVNGFYVQEETADADADPSTSEGVHVFTDSPPPGTVVLGNRVRVTGTVSESVPPADSLQPPLTEIVSPTIVELATGQALPAPVPLSTTFPDPAGPHDQLERHEGMRVSAASLTVVGPTLGSVSEENATATSTGVFYSVVTGVARPFREAGIPAPDPAPSGGGAIPPIPRFDSNPERIRVDSDALVGAAAIDVGTGAVVTNVVGPLDYSFRTYTILPDPAAATPSGAPSPTAVSTPADDDVTIASYNLGRFFDTSDNPTTGDAVLTPTAYDNRLGKASLQIRNYLKMPDIVALVEVEYPSVASDLAERISLDAVAAGQPDPVYHVYLAGGGGHDVDGMIVAFLAKRQYLQDWEPRVEPVSYAQLGSDELFVNADASTEYLFERPPFVFKAIVHHPNQWTYPVTVIVNHLRSLDSANSEAAGSNGWPTAGARVRAKRQKQAEWLANSVQARQVADPEEGIVVLGDFNFFEVNDGLGHGMGVLLGTPVPDNQTAVPGDGIDLVDPDLVRISEGDAAERYSFIFDGNAQSRDHVLVSAEVVSSTSARRVEHPRVNADFPETDRSDYSAGNPRRLANHDPLVMYLAVTEFANGVFRGDFETGSVCRWSTASPAVSC